MSQPKAPRYADELLNALMYPHQMTARGELWFADTMLADIPIVSGTLNADRGSVVRRTMELEIDPGLAPRSINDQLTPFGSWMRVLRGVRFPNGTVIEEQVFSGRVDAVEFGRSANRVRCSDMAAAIVDGRFEQPYTASKGMLVVDQMKALILDVIPDAQFDIDTTSTATITTPATWDRERAPALDNLATTLGCDWMYGPDGMFHIIPMPTLVDSAAEWVIDAGDVGVTITHLTTLDRAQTYNAVVVNGEPPDGRAPVVGIAHDTDPTSPTRWGGPFGKVPKFFSSQFITTQAQADSVALSMLGDMVSGTRSVAITCIPNPRLRTNMVVYVNDGSGSDWSGLYYVQSLTLPLDPESPMQVICKTALQVDPGNPLQLRRAPVRFVEGINYGH